MDEASGRRRKVRSKEGIGHYIEEDSASENDGEEWDYESIAELNRSLHEVLQGTNPIFIQRSVKIQKSKAKRQIAADKLRKLQIENVNALFEFDTVSLDSQITRMIEESKDMLLEDLYQEIRKLNRLKTSYDDVFGDMSSKLNVQIVAGESIVKIKNAAVPTRSAETTNALTLSLSDVAISFDIREIYKDMNERAKYFLSDSDQHLNSATIGSGGALEVNGVQFSVGDRVTVTSRVSSEDYIGNITFIRDTFVDVSVQDSTVCRVYIDHLKAGKVDIRIRNDRKSSRKQMS